MTFSSPLTHVVELLRFGAFGEAHFSSPWVPLAVSGAFLAASCAVAGPAFRNYANR